MLNNSIVLVNTRNLKRELASNKLISLIYFLNIIKRLFKCIFEVV